MEERNKVRVVIYENPDRILLIDELAKKEEISRAELYRRAIRLYIGMKAGVVPDAPKGQSPRIEIEYNFDTRKYDLYFDGKNAGSYPDYSEALKSAHYGALEHEYFGDPDLGTGIYAIPHGVIRSDKEEQR